MRSKEKLYERPLKRPIDDQTQAVIHSELDRPRAQLPMPTELSWNGTKPELTMPNKCLAARSQ